MTWIRWGAALGLALALAGCGDDDDDGFNPTTGDVAGSYTATTFTVTSGVAEVDLLALEASVTATLDADGTTMGRLHVPSVLDQPQIDEDLAGTWTLEGTTVTFSPTSSTLIEDVDFTVGTNTLTGEGTFDGSALLLLLTKDD
jgi:hypothetical protein